MNEAGCITQQIDEEEKNVVKVLIIQIKLCFFAIFFFFCWQIVIFPWMVLRHYVLAPMIVNRATSCIFTFCFTVVVTITFNQRPRHNEMWTEHNRVNVTSAYAIIWLLAVIDLCLFRTPTGCCCDQRRVDVSLTVNYCIILLRMCP